MPPPLVTQGALSKMPWLGSAPPWASWSLSSVFCAFAVRARSRHEGPRVHIQQPPELLKLRNEWLERLWAPPLRIPGKNQALTLFPETRTVSAQVPRLFSTPRSLARPLPLQPSPRRTTGLIAHKELRARPPEVQIQPPPSRLWGCPSGPRVRRVWARPHSGLSWAGLCVTWKRLHTPFKRTRISGRRRHGPPGARGPWLQTQPPTHLLETSRLLR